MTSVRELDVMARFTSAEFRRDPYPFLRWLREHEPVHRTGKGFHLISRHADASWVLRDPDRIFRTPDRDRLTQQFPAAAGHRSVTLLLNSLPALNAPAHTRIRRLVARDFTPKRVANLHERIERTFEGLLDGVTDRLRAGHVVDLHSTLTKPFALAVIADLLGVPAEVRDNMAPNASELASALGSGDESLLARADDHAAQLESHFQDLIALRRREPGGDLLSALVRDRGDQDQLSPDELISMLWVLWNVGFEGTAAAIEHGVRAMVDHPEQSHWLRDHRSAVAFADEVLRHTGPQIFLGVSQIATRDIELSGVRIPAGGQLRPVMAAANRDPEVFADPDRFDPWRDNSASLVFGRGAHHCLGVFLTRAEIATALRLLHERHPDLRLAGEPTWSESFTMRVATRFPVVLDGQRRG
ncbi:cytochrome P450 [Kutzneria sp. CA-103260]|uniref:cytochrome P450 n=1 Tax=Kutzneria sp. CA-103260 TaxID=2802641 RepID=UPI001BA70E6D|nr:cytochrome P450 [Kutzneria sp. CA-103260]QUQ65533.1 cytochrome P450 hydroxylase [Kutzneria sp. CA-103260]